MAIIQRLGLLRASVASYASLPITENVQNDMRITSDTGNTYIWTKYSSSGVLSD
jgi:hypothetical protein